MSNYEEWKNWRLNDFATLSRKDESYFKEITKKFTLGENTNILEIGFGNGSFLKFGKKYNCKIAGIEIIPELVTRAKDNGYEAYTDLDEISVERKFDLIVMFDVLEHIQQNEIVEFLIKINNLLNDGGVLLLRTPNGSSPFGLTNQHGDITHCTVVTPPKLDFWAQNTGFNLDLVGGDPYIINEGKVSKVPSRFIRRMVYLFVERLARWIFSPQSKGFLSSNLFAVLRKNTI